MRTVLGDFLRNRDSVFKDGLIGGTLFTALLLLDLATKNPKLGYEGTDKINGRTGLRASVTFRARVPTFDSGSFLMRRLFKHARSTYAQVMSAMQGRTDKDSARQSASRYQVVEEFGDYKKEGGLMLPHTYKLQLLIDDYSGLKQVGVDANAYAV